MSDLTSSMAGIAVFGAIFGAIFRSWASIRSFGQRCLGLFIIQAHLSDEETSKAVLGYLAHHYPRGRSGQMIFGGRYESFKDGRVGHIPFELLGGKTVLFWRGWLPFWFSVAENNTEKDKSGGSVIYWGSKPKEVMKGSVVFFRGLLDVENIVREAVQERNSRHWTATSSQRRRFFIKKIPDPNQANQSGYSAGTNLEWFHEGIYRLLDHEPSELGQAVLAQGAGSLTDTLYFPDNVKTVINEIRAWRDLKDWYLARNIPWKRGCCFYGPPGTGKSVLVRAIAEDLDMPLFSYALGRLVDGELEKSWNEMRTHAPCIALLEDFDTVFDGRQNIYGKPPLGSQLAQTIKNADTNMAQDGQLNFGCLLNCIDGVDKSGGIFVVITTNHIDKLDPALGQPCRNEDGTKTSSRPGRIDRVVELGYMENCDKIKLAKRIFSDDDNGYDLMLSKIREEPQRKETPAQFQERCAQLALELLWNDRCHKPKKDVIRQLVA